MKDNSKLIKQGARIKLLRFETLLKECELIPLGGPMYRLPNMEQVFIGEEEKLDWRKPKLVTKKENWFRTECIETPSENGTSWVYPIRWILKTIK